MSDTRELSALKEERVSDLQLNDATCLRFLIAREFDLKKAEDMIRHNEKWRREVDIENIFSSELPTFIKEDFNCRFTGASRNGGPVFLLSMGQWKARYWIDRGGKEDVIRFGFHILENILTRITNMNDTKAVVILGMEELTYYKVGNVDTLRVLYGGFQALEQNYPEILQNLIIVNAPWAFTLAFNFIKPILSAKTLGKIQIYGSDKKQWLPVLQNLCLEDAIPEEYVGN